ncbi:MAG TPA: DUF2383 domain-containing protein [Firmicutes bacterium]|jgi:bacterioferritin|nr:DUF2383 domain-containing protein [Bacillota bacterium]
MGEQQGYIDTLNELLKGELMAMEIYKETQALQGDEQVREMLQQFAADHEEHARLLAQRIKELGGTPITSAGMAGTMAGLWSKINALRGPAHLLQQVYTGEDRGVHAYEDRIDELDPQSQVLVSEIMSTDHDHLKRFKERMETEKREQ